MSRTSIDGDRLSIVMKDISREVFVTLQYQTDAETGILRRSAEIENRTNAPFTIEQAAAATWNLPRGTDYRLRYLTGRWAAEWKRAAAADPSRQDGAREPPRHDRRSRTIRGLPSTTAATTIRRHGEVWFGALGWSGSWRITVEQDQLEQVRVTGGFNPFDFGYRLAARRAARDAVLLWRLFEPRPRRRIAAAAPLRDRRASCRMRPRPSCGRSSTTRGKRPSSTSTKPGQMALAEKAASIGVERFVMDDGWFGQRKDDHAGLGDWYVNPQKFPHGLKPLIDKVHSLGMDFGLWVEPEMVNPDSDLYRKHPDWVLNFPGRPRTEGRNQLVLNLARPDVRDYVFGFLDKLLTENDIAFLKWDYNRNWTEPGWPAVAARGAEEGLRRVHPQPLLDPRGAAREASQASRSRPAPAAAAASISASCATPTRSGPRTTPIRSTGCCIQDGFTYAYTPRRHDGVGHRLAELGQRAHALARVPLPLVDAGLARHRRQPEQVDAGGLRHGEEDGGAVQGDSRDRAARRAVSADLARDDSEQSVTESVSRDGRQAVIFAFLHSSRERYPFPRVHLRGLDEDATYRVAALDGKLAADTPTVASGAYWMHRGVDVELRGDFQAAAFTLERVAGGTAEK